MSGRHVLIIGAGSVGRRHARNLASLGCRISAMDPRAERGAELAAETPVVATFTDLDAALAAPDLDAVAVCSPTAFHVDQAIAALRAGLPVLLEKPVAKDLATAQRLADVVDETGLPLLLGYTWRWWPPLANLRQRLADGVVGPLRHVDFIMSAHLADWHPGEPLAEFFMSSAALGGGALLDESHWIDLMLWLFGLPTTLSASVETISDLEITSDDNVDMQLSYPDGLRVRIHLDLFGRPHRKEIRFVGENGTILWSEAPNRIAVAHGMTADWQTTDFDGERNDMFMGVAREFLALLDGNATPTCTLADGLNVMRLIEAARQSQADGRRIVLA